MAIRKIIQIDEDKCNGCGLCIPNCAEGALKIVDGKVKLIHDKYCDGLGACLGHCPQGALRLIEREAAEFDEKAVEELLAEQKAAQGGGCKTNLTCPGSKVRNLEESSAKENQVAVDTNDLVIKIKSQLTNWPVQLSLVPPTADFFQGAELLLTADCVPFAYPNYHLDLLKGKKVIIGCPKLDDLGSYMEKLTEIIVLNDLKSITVAYMEVPCCLNLVRALEIALAGAGKNIPLNKIMIRINGEKEVMKSI